MPAAAVVTLIGVGILVLALAFYLIRIAWTLRQVIDTLGKITFGVRAIAFQTRPVNEIAGEIHADVKAMEEALQTLLEAKLSRQELAG
jgi:uncharacterized protein YoxC